MTNTKAQLHKHRQKQGRRADFPRLLGGNLCLDFVNTIEGRRDPHPVEFLHRYQDVVHWGEHVSMLTHGQAARLLKAASASPELAAACFEWAIALREVLHRLFLAQAHQTKPSQSDINHLKQIYITALSHAELSQTPQAYQWQWSAAEGALDAVLWAVARAAVNLLCSSGVQRVKECTGADDCGWLFLDASKNNSRRWCSMEGCGSRVKMRRQYARKRGV
jgi:predicted RNA-binding Zn ribbon-like protein